MKIQRMIGVQREVILDQIELLDLMGIKHLWSKSRLREELSLPLTDLFIAFDEEQDDRIIGYVLASETDGVITIKSLVVHPSYWGRGVGAELVGVIKRLASYQITLMVRESNERAIKFYKRQGFVRMGKKPHYYGDDEHAIKMLYTKKEARCA